MIWGGGVGNVKRCSSRFGIGQHYLGLLSVYVFFTETGVEIFEC